MTGLLIASSAFVFSFVLPPQSMGSRCPDVRLSESGSATTSPVVPQCTTSPVVLQCTTAKWEHGERETAALAKIAELEKGFTSEPKEVKAQLYGMWKLLIADDADELSTQGMTGYGAPSHNTVLGHFQLFEPKSETDDERPTMQTVEVVSNRAEGRCAIASLKGDFYVGKLQGSSDIGVVEDYTRIEYAGDSRYDATIEPERWTCAFLSPALRVCRLEGGLTRIYAKVGTQEAQAEIGRLLKTKVDELDDGDDADDDSKDDDRPLWQKRLDEEDGRTPGERGNRFDGPSIHSDIP